MTIVHGKVSAAEAPSDPAKVGGPDWNDAHCYGAGALVPVAVYECQYNGSTGDIYYDRQSPTPIFGVMATKSAPGLWLMAVDAAPVNVAADHEVVYFCCPMPRPLFTLAADTNFRCEYIPADGPEGADVLYFEIGTPDGVPFDPTGSIRITIQLWARVVPV